MLDEIYRKMKNVLNIIIIRNNFNFVFWIFMHGYILLIQNFSLDRSCYPISKYFFIYYIVLVLKIQIKNKQQVMRNYWLVFKMKYFFFKNVDKRAQHFRVT